MENMSDTKVNYNNHYHLGERTTSAINIMSGIKSLVCDLHGIIIAEMVYRCMICDDIFETIPDVQIHYQTKHIDGDIQSCLSGNHTHCTSSAVAPNPKPDNTTNVSFMECLQSTADSYLDSIPAESPNALTLTFDVPSGLKTLQQQFESSAKTVQTSQPKKRSNKPFTSGNSKTKTGFNHKSKALGQKTGSPFKSGFITCEICGATKFYKYTQRRFGVYSCVGCAKFYSKYLIKPVHYMCENLGKCNLKVSECVPNGRCKACLIHKCESKFTIDSKKLNNYNKIHSILSQNENKKVLNESKAKTNSKSIPGKDSIRGIKTKTSNQLSVETKLKSTLTSIKAKSETETSSVKANSFMSFNKKSKSDKNLTKNANEIQNKKGLNTTPLVKASTDKTSVRLKRNNLKSTEDKPIEKRTRSQSTCRKCFGLKAKDCSNCAEDLRPTVEGKDNDKQKVLKKSYCLTRNRNK